MGKAGNEKKAALTALLLTAALVGAATGVGWVFRVWDFPETTIVLVYILSVVLTARFTDGYFWGILATGLATCAFNAFFTREILPGRRPGRTESDARDLISPADSRLTVYPIGGDTSFRIKYGTYSVASLLGGEDRAAAFAGGYCMVFRLSVDDYHRYCFFDSGRMGCRWRIPGRYYTVQPAALRTHDYFKENTRECCLLETDRFGTAACVEIGATFVGRIVNRDVQSFARGEEKGRFEFGGSTVVLLLEKGAARIDADILENSQRGLETRVRIGEPVGRALR